MTLRDGLQALNTYPLKTKLKCVDEIFRNNFYYIDYGTVTIPNSTSQMHNSDKILDYIKIKYPNTKTIYGILIPKINLLSYDIINNNSAFSLLCTIDDNYSYTNFKKSANDNFNDVINMIQVIIKYCDNLKKIRINIACAFNKNNINLLYKYTSTIIKLVNKFNLNSDVIDIVFADTYNCITYDILFDTLSLFTSKKKKYIGLRVYNKNFLEIIELCKKMNINKIDTELCISNKETKNISTIDLVKYLNLPVETVTKTENNIKNILFN